MIDADVLARGLRAGVRLRDKMVVVEIDPAAAAEPAKLDALATDLALARALGLRIITVCTPGAGLGSLDALRPALHLTSALDRHQQRGISLPAAGVVTVHRIPQAALAAAPGTPPMIPVVNIAILVHLVALGYVPILVPPVVDASGEPATDVATGAVAEIVARFVGAALLLVSPSGAQLPLFGEASGLPKLPPVVVLGPSVPGALIADILLNAPEAPASPVGIPGATQVAAPVMFPNAAR